MIFMLFQFLLTIACDFIVVVVAVIVVVVVVVVVVIVVVIIDVVVVVAFACWLIGWLSVSRMKFRKLCFVAVWFIV